MCTPPNLPALVLEPEPAAAPPPPPPLLLAAAFFSLVFLPLPLAFFFPAAGAPAGSELLLLPLPDGGLVEREELRVEDGAVDAAAAGFGRLEERPHLPPCWMPVVWVARRTVTFSLSDSLTPIAASWGMSSGLGSLSRGWRTVEGGGYLYP